MSDSKDKSREVPPPGDANRRSGRAAVDERGNSVWEWQLETGVYSRDVNTQRLKKLESDELSLVETGAHSREDLSKQEPKLAGNSKPSAAAPSPGRLAGGGFNPYDNAAKVGGEGANPYDNARNLNKSFERDSGPKRTRTPDELRKLDEFLKAQRKLEKDK